MLILQHHFAMLDLETADYVIIIDKFPEISELKILLGLRAIIL